MNPIVASEEILAKYNASLVREPSSSMSSKNSSPIPELKLCYLSYKDWKFSSSHDKILDSIQLLSMQRNLIGKFSDEDEVGSYPDEFTVNGFHIHLPAMIFGNEIFTISFLSPTNESAPKKSFEVSLTAVDALERWILSHSKAYMKANPWKAVEVPFSKSWKMKNNESMKSSSEKIAMNDLLAWDWTFTTDYCGSISRNLWNGETLTHDKLDVSISKTNKSYDILNGRRLQLLSSGEGVSDEIGLCTERIEYSGLESHMELLIDTTQPILLFDEGIIYQDDLEDCGEVSMTYKLRVMPKFWLLLVRLFVRVDGSVIRIRESRFLHIFDTDSIFLDVSWSELSFIDCPAEPGDPMTSQFKDKEYIALRDTIAKDVKLQCDANNLSKILPRVHCSPQYYRILL